MSSPKEFGWGEELTVFHADEIKNEEVLRLYTFLMAHNGSYPIETGFLNFGQTPLLPVWMLLGTYETVLLDIHKFNGVV